MRCANVGRSHRHPFRIEPAFGKVTEDSVESENKVPCDILQHDESWFHKANGIGDPRPEVSGIIGALSSACAAERLAGIASGEDVNLTGKRRPVNEFQVAELFGVRESDGLHGAGVTINVRHPAGVRASDNRLNGKIQPAVTGAERQDGQHGCTRSVAPVHVSASRFDADR